MTDRTQTEVRLRRSLPGRLFAGSPFQWMPTLAILLDIFLIVVVSSFSSLGKVLPAAVPGAVILIIWLVGVCATARADSDGVHWRYYVTHHSAWSAGADPLWRAAGQGAGSFGQPTILVTVGGREHPITPA